MRHLKILVLLFSFPLISCNNTANNIVLSGNQTTTSTKSASADLPVEKVQSAVDKALFWTRKGGSAAVLGVQEIPQGNVARVNIQFNNFQFNSDSAGNPISRDQKDPQKPDINSPDFYDQVYKYGTQQTETRNYSGQGVGTLAHYNDGRWVLANVNFNAVGVIANEEIK